MSEFQSAFTTTLTKKLDPSDLSISIENAVTVGRGRIYMNNDTQDEFIKFETTADAGLTLGTLTRNLSKTADPATGGAGLTWLAGSEIKIVFMHDEIFNKQRPEGLSFADTTARDAALGADGVPTQAWILVYTIAEGLFRNYNLSTAQREAVDSGTVTPNMTESSSGSGELGTQAENDAGSEVGTAGPLVTNPLRAGRTSQKQANIFGTTTGLVNAYIFTPTPAIDAYVEGMKFSIKINITNTLGSTVNVSGKGIVSLLDKYGNALIKNSLIAGRTYEIQYNGTAFKILEDEIVFPGTTVTYWTQAVNTSVPATYTYVAEKTGTFVLNYDLTQSGSGAGDVEYADVDGVRIGLKSEDDAAIGSVLYSWEGSIAIGAGDTYNFATNITMTKGQTLSCRFDGGGQSMTGTVTLKGNK